MKQKKFLLCSTILMMIYFCGTLSYYSQIFMLERYYNSNTVTSFLSGWNYLGQAIGILLFICLAKKYLTRLDQTKWIALSMMLSIPVVAISMSASSIILRLSMIILSNVLIGIYTAYGIWNITRHVSQNRYGLCFALAYAIGGIATWLISNCSPVMTGTPWIIVPFTLFTVCTVGLIVWSKASLAENDITIPNEVSIKEQNIRSIFLLISVVALMSVIISLGSNDSILTQASKSINPLTTRIYYAVGLILAGIIFDYSARLGGVLALAAAIYPMMATILYGEFPNNMLIIGLTDTFTGFFAVWRAAIFMKLFSRKMEKDASENSDIKIYAPLGLMISRIVEGCMVLLLCLLRPTHLIAFLISGILFVLLVIVFYFFTQAAYNPVQEIAIQVESVVEAVHPSEQDAAHDESNSDANPITNLNSKLEYSSNLWHVTFAEQYQLTRREEEIAKYLAESKSNGEIAAALQLSESTIRFHVSNILKKTGFKNRNEVAREYLKANER